MEPSSLAFRPRSLGSFHPKVAFKVSVKLCILRSLDLQIQSLSCTSASALEFFTCYLRFAPQTFCPQPPCGCCLLRNCPVSSAAPSDGPVTLSARVSFRSLASAWLPPPSSPFGVLGPFARRLRWPILRRVLAVAVRLACLT